jgi:hypothetical protein
MGWSTRRALASICVGGGALFVAASPAGADVIDPEGACQASGTWQDEGVTRASADFSSDDVVVIPQEDSVGWEGGVGGAAPGETGPERDISGEVEVDVAGVTAITIDDWDGPSELYGNSGDYEYEVPDVLVNVKMKLQGEQREEGSTVCSGSVYIKVEGGTFSNPLAIAFLVLMVLTGAGLFYAGSVKKGVT